MDSIQHFSEYKLCSFEMITLKLIFINKIYLLMKTLSIQDPLKIKINVNTISFKIIKQYIKYYFVEIPYT